MEVWQPSDVIAIVAIVVGAVVAIGGSVIAARSALAVQRRQADAERYRERQTRIVANRTALYMDVMEYVYRLADLVDRTEPFISFAGDPGPPDFPSDEETRVLNARAAAFGSKAVRESFPRPQPSGSGVPGPGMARALPA